MVPAGRGLPSQSDAARQVALGVDVDEQDALYRREPARRRG